jgi:hypothetical protein
MSKTLFEQAIAEAKDVRKTALENAKLALEESMTSRLQNMFSTKLSEELEEDENLNEIEEDENVNEIEESKDLNEEADDDSDSESETEEETDDSEETEEVEAEVTDDASAETDEESVEDKSVSDLSVEELKDVIRTVVQSELASEVSPADDGTLDGLGDDVSDDMTNADAAPVLGAGDEMGDDLGLDSEEDEDVNLEEVFAELEAINNGGTNIKEAAKVKKSVIKKSTNNKTGAPGFKKVGTLTEAVNTINYLRKELKDMNLLNAKLIYVNSIFKGRTLNEAQKIKIIEKFDKATNIKEAKLLFETLMEAPKSTLKTTPKKALRESLSFASKAAGNAPKKVIAKVDESVKRFQELAGIIKK